MILNIIILIVIAIFPICIGRNLREMHRLNYKPDVMPEKFFDFLPTYSKILEFAGYAILVFVLIMIIGHFTGYLTFLDS